MVEIDIQPFAWQGLWRVSLTFVDMKNDSFLTSPFFNIPINVSDESLLSGTNKKKSASVTGSVEIPASKPARQRPWFDSRQDQQY